jgi:hypothetical protein
MEQLEVVAGKSGEKPVTGTYYSGTFVAKK